MKNKRVALLAMTTALILLAIVAIETRGLFAGETPKAPKGHPLHIKKINNEWRVVHAQNGASKPVTAAKGDSVVWTGLGSDVFLQFPDSTLFGTYTATITAGNNLTLTVVPTATAGRYPYSAFCLADKKFARGDSPPIIIIE